MKKSSFLAAALVAAAAAGDAAALDAGFTRHIRVTGLSAGMDSLGAWDLTPLGRNGRFCDYLANWHSDNQVINPNGPQLCLLHELATPFTPNCSLNELRDITTTVEAGHAAGAVGIDGVGVGSPLGCSGFNVKGEVSLHVTLVLTESPMGLQGIEIFRSVGIAVLYPVFID